ncbi:hypothetical protein Ppb6_02862 [Photorhabdus australis subsp. thailandensis]|uniref:Uncharacterized protein n=1 Tax=Photorhabdus australis subsp. thailandensis TaxID=2805096 RepID=A0A1C0U1X9_9GAMM|nr:hypothetical protein Ppb6_02862 [Photorhabdus australis subsp. thailandensis]
MRAVGHQTRSRAGLADAGAATGRATAGRRRSRRDNGSHGQRGRRSRRAGVADIAKPDRTDYQRHGRLWRGRRIHQSADRVSGGSLAQTR